MIFSDDNQIILGSFENIGDTSMSMGNRSVYADTPFRVSCYFPQQSEPLWQIGVSASQVNYQDGLFPVSWPISDTESAPAILCQTANIYEVLDAFTGACLKRFEMPAPVIDTRLDEEGNGFSCVMYNGEMGRGRFSSASWISAKYWDSNLKKAWQADNAYYIQNSLSSSIIKYQSGVTDGIWTPFDGENHADNLIEASLFQGGCFTLLSYQEELLYGNIKQSKSMEKKNLRELLLPLFPPETKEEDIRIRMLGSSEDGSCLYLEGRAFQGEGKLLTFYPESCTLDISDYPADFSEKLDSYQDPVFNGQYLLGFWDSPGLFSLEPPKETGCRLVLWDPKQNIIDSLPIFPEATYFSDQQIFADPDTPYCLVLLRTEDRMEAIIVEPDTRTVKNAAASAAKRLFETAGENRFSQYLTAWNADGTLAAVSNRNVLLLINRDGDLIGEIELPKSRIESMKFTPDGKNLLVVSGGKDLYRYDTVSLTLEGKTELYYDSFLDTYAWNFTDNGQLFLSVNSCMNLISTENWGVYAYVPHCLGYIADADSFCIYDYVSNGYSIGCARRYTTEALIQKGYEILGDFDLEEEQKKLYGIE